MFEKTPLSAIILGFGLLACFLSTCKGLLNEWNEIGFGHAQPLKFLSMNKPNHFSFEFKDGVFFICVNVQGSLAIGTHFFLSMMSLRTALLLNLGGGNLIGVKAR